MVIESITLIATPFPSFILFLFKGVSPAKVVSTAIAKSGTGIPATTLSIPMRYMHTHLGVVHKDDIIATLKLLKLIVEDLTPEKYDRILKENYNYSE